MSLLCRAAETPSQVRGSTRASHQMLCACCTGGNPAFHYGLRQQGFTRLQKTPSLVGEEDDSDTTLRLKYFIKTEKTIYCLLKQNVGGRAFLRHGE